MFLQSKSHYLKFRGELIFYYRAQSLQSNKQVRESYLKILLEKTYMKMKILLSFWLFLLRLQCWLTDAAERTAEWKQSALAGRKWSTKYGCIRCYDGGEGTTGDIKITRDEAMSAHELNEICAFLLLTTLKVLSFSQLKYQQRLQPKKTCQFLPSSIRRAANRMSWNVD